MSSGVFVAANENWLTGSLFDWMDWSGWDDLKSWFGFKKTSVVTPGDQTNTMTTTTGTNNVTTTGTQGKDYKENCVYLYSGKDAKSGYMSTNCVDEKKKEKTLTGVSNVTSLRVGNEVRAVVSRGDQGKDPLIINGTTVGGAVKPFNLSDKGFTEKASWITLGYKGYASDGTLESIGMKDIDENCIYMYDDREGKSRVFSICKAEMSGKLPANHAIRRASSIRVGKNMSLVMTDSDALSKNRLAIAFGEGSVKKLIDLEPLRLNNRVQYVNIHSRK